MMRTPLLRPRLFDRVNHPSLALVTLITAPAGSGKSTLATQWRQSASHAVGMVALDEASNTPDHFHSELMAAISEALPDLDLPADEPPTMDAIAESLRVIRDAQRELTIILDDYHLIENRDIHDAMNAYLHQPLTCIHIMILSHTTPPLELGHLQAHGQVRHLTEADLCFTPAEVEHLLADSPISRDQVARLTTRTGGWISGVQLAMMAPELTLGDHSEQFDRVIESLSEHRGLNDEIIEEVLNELPADLRHFVLGTTILTSLDPDLCDAVLAIGTSENLIRKVENRIHFVQRPTTRDAFPAYHRLFAQSVERISMRDFSRPERQVSHLRAARWYERQGRLEPAIDHAIRAEAWDVTERLITKVCQPLINADLMHSALFWLRKLPPACRRANDDLAYWYIKELQRTGQFREAAEELKLLEPRWLASGASLLRGYLAACHANIAVVAGEDDLALRKWYETLHVMPISRTIERFHAWSLVHHIESLRGNDDAAEQAFRQVKHCRIALPRAQNWWTSHVELDRANHHALRADLVTAEHLYLFQLKHISLSTRHVEAKIRSRLAAIYLEWNDLDRAIDQTQHIEEDFAVYPVQAWHPEAMLAVARVHWACGDRTRAEEVLQQIFELHRLHGGEHTLQQLLALQASFRIATGQLGLVKEWMNRNQISEYQRARVYGEGDTRSLRIQFLVATDEPEQASLLARQGIMDAIRLKHWPSFIETQVWDAVSQLTLRNEGEARNALRAGLRAGSKGRFIRAFHPQGHDLHPVLRQMRPTLEPDQARYVDRILASQIPAAKTPSPLATPDTIRIPLTEREQEVLELLHTGYTNQEIADQLFITERTVKKHVSNILSKLEVANRTSAVTRARQNGLLM